MAASIPRTPDVAAQRAAMQKLSFLIGKWLGEARANRGPGQTLELAQSEDAQYKLDGLVLMIEGVGRNKAGGALALQALGLISFDDETGKYWMRAFNDGRWLETEVKLVEEGRAISWGFSLGSIRTSSLLRIDDNGDWTESAEIFFGEQPARPLMQLRVSKLS